LASRWKAVRRSQHQGRRQPRQGAGRL